MNSSIIWVALLGVISSAYGEELTCRDDSWVKAAPRNGGEGLCFKTFIFEKQLTYEESKKKCTDLNGYPAPMEEAKDEKAILESVSRVQGDLQKIVEPVEIYLGARRKENRHSILFEWEFGNKEIIYEDTRWDKSRSQPDGHTEGHNQNCVSFHPRDYNDTIKFHDTMCDCSSPNSFGCDTHTRVGITCVTRPAIMVMNNWEVKECEDGEYCDEILKKMQYWFGFVRANKALSSETIYMIRQLYARNATYTYELTKNGNLTVNQQNKPISMLFLDNFVKELQNNAHTITVKPDSITQEVEENYFDAVFSFNDGNDFAAHLGTKYNENLEIIEQTFRVTRGKAPEVVATSTVAALEARF